MVPCGVRPDKELKAAPKQRLEMVQRAVDDYFPEGYPIKVDDIEVKNGPSIPTYFLMKELEGLYDHTFYFMMGSDLIPGLINWDEGQKMVDEINYIVFERKGYEYILDPSVEKDY